jgi:hypothetical protein
VSRLTDIDFAIITYNVKASRGETSTSDPAQDAVSMTQADRVLSTATLNTSVSNPTAGLDWLDIKADATAQLPVGPARNQLRKLARGLLRLHKLGYRANIQIVEAEN